MAYPPLFLKLRVTAAMPNPSKVIKKMATKPPTMAAIRFVILPEGTTLKKVCMYVCTIKLIIIIIIIEGYACCMTCVSVLHIAYVASVCVYSTYVCITNPLFV